MMFRSTKGASKQRRDLINVEILQIRDLLPLPESARMRLSQLQIMSLACCYIRKNSYFSKLFGNSKPCQQPRFEFSQAMSGFLLITNKEGKLLYISENVTEFLGHSMVDMLTQGDSLYDIIDKRDHSNVQSQLSQVNVGGAVIDEKTFFCRMNVSRSLRRQGGYGDHKVMYCRGHYAQSIDHYGNQPVFVATVTPLITPDVKESILQNNTMIYQSVHSLDMKFIELTTNGKFHLGYNEEEVKGRSWYEFIHPDDVNEAKEKHAQLIKTSHEMGCMLTVRVQNADFEWKWVNIVMHVRQTPNRNADESENTESVIVCINQMIHESEANHFKLQSQLYSSHIARSPEFLPSASDSSPPHSITKFTFETSDTYGATQQMGFQSTGSSPRYYPGNTGNEYGVIQTTAESTVPLTTVDLSNSSMSEGSGSDSRGDETWAGSRSKKTVFNHLKRKLNGMQTTQAECKPAKKTKYGNDGTTGGQNITNDLSYTLTTLTNMQSVGFMTLSNGSYCGGDGGLLMQVGTDTPVYAQLKNGLGLKQKMITKQPATDMMMIAASKSPIRSPGPLTPESLISDVTSSTLAQQTSLGSTLRIDVTAPVVLPTSMLTPDASPINSPAYVSNGSPAQCVPSMIDDLDETIIKEEIQMMPKDKPKTEKIYKMCPSTNLPELDAMCIDSFFGTLDDLSKSLTLPAVQAPVLTPVHQPPVQIKQEAIEDFEFNDDIKAMLSDDKIVEEMNRAAERILLGQDGVLSDFKVEVEDDTMVPGQFPGVQSAQFLTEDLLDFNQYGHLAATSSEPSYGDEDFATAVFKQNL